MSDNLCLMCHTELGAVDDDPNGEKNPVCARCRAEEEHDFDAEPHVKFNRDGSSMTDTKDIGNLTLNKRVGDSIQIGDDITVTIIDTKGSKVRLSIQAPKKLRIRHTEGGKHEE